VNKIMAFLSGAMLGAVVGAAAALLLTPSSGQELQEQTRDWFDTLLDDARQAAADRRAELEEQLASLKREPPAASPLSR
jgi:gas vesicle protein